MSSEKFMIHNLQFKIHQVWFIFTIGLLVLLVNNGISQNRNFNTENLYWYEGYITFLDGSKVSGKLNFNFVSETLRLQRNENIEILNASKVLQFTYLDKANDQQIVYYSLPYRSEERFDRDRATFFKVVFKNKSFAVLSRNILEYEDRALGPWSTLNGNDDLVALGKISSEKIIEEVYIANNKGDVLKVMSGKKDKTLIFKEIIVFNEDVLGTKRKFKERKTDDKVVNYKLEDKRWIKNFFVSNSDQIKDYIDNEKIKTDTNKGLIKIVKFASTLN